MPCQGGEPSVPNHHVEKMLCAALTFIEHSLWDEFIKSTDWEEAGIDKWLLVNWWLRHKEQDASRRQAEALYTAQEEAKRSAILKLTVDERRLLGLTPRIN